MELCGKRRAHREYGDHTEGMTGANMVATGIQVAMYFACIAFLFVGVRATCIHYTKVPGIFIACTYNADGILCAPQHGECRREALNSYHQHEH